MKQKYTHTRDHKNDEFLSLLRSSRNLLNKNSQFQIAGKLRKNIRLNKSIKTHYATGWSSVKLNTKERSIQKEMSVRAALSKISR